MVKKRPQPAIETLAKEICRRMAKDRLGAPPIDTGRPPTLVAEALAYAVEQGWLGPDFTLTTTGAEIGLRARTGNKLRRRESYF